MKVINLSESTFESTVASGIVLVDFWAAWCAPCRIFAPVFDAAAARHPGVTFAKVDTAGHPALADAFGIQSIPTLVAFRDGVMLFARAGVMPGPALDGLVAALAAIDMDDIRRRIASGGTSA